MLASGQVKIEDLGAQSKLVPPIFFWMIGADGENWILGLERAAELYYSRALYRAEVLLNSALPISVLVLGLIISVQVISMVQLTTNNPNLLELFEYAGADSGKEQKDK